MPPLPETTIAVSDQTSGSITFKVTRSYPYDKNDIIVINACWNEEGTEVIRTGFQVLWGAWNSLIGTTGGMPTGGIRGEAYVAIKNKQQGDAITYTVP